MHYPQIYCFGNNYSEPNVIYNIHIMYNLTCALLVLNVDSTVKMAH